VPIHKKSRGGQEGKEKDRGSNKEVLGMNFPPSPRARSSSAGVLGKDRDKDKSDGDGDLNESPNPAGGRGAGSNTDGGRMAWLQWPAAGHMTSVSNYGNGADTHRRESSVPMELNNSEVRESHSPSIPTGEDACLLLYSYLYNQSTGGKHRKNAFLRRAASTSAKYDKSSRRRLELGRLGTVNWVSEGTALPKPPPRGWRQIAVGLFRGDDCNPGQTVVRRANSEKKERSNSISST